MAKRFTLEILMDLAKTIGANPNKFMGTKTNITFLGKGPTKNPLFQNRLAGLENASLQNLGKPETLVNAVEDAMSFASAGKLNTIQTEILGHNLLGIKNIIKPPALPSASVTPIRSGITTLKSNDIGAGPRLYNKLTGYNKPRVVDDRGRTWDFKSRAQETGPGDIEAFNVALNQKTGMSRAIARQILQQDTRLKLPEEVLISLRTGSRGQDPLALMSKYYGRSMENFDDFLNNVSLEASNPRDLATRVLSEVELVPQFAEGGLARILEV